MSFDYKRYLASREWALRKEQVLDRSRGFCERCGLAPYESTHHVTYAHIGNEPLEDLLGVCNPCHEFLSAKSDYDPASKVRLMVLVVNPERMQKVRSMNGMFSTGLSAGITDGCVRVLGDLSPKGFRHVSVIAPEQLERLEWWQWWQEHRTANEPMGIQTQGDGCLIGEPC